MSIISIKQNQQITNKQNQHLLLSMAMRQAFHVLQMPALELSEWLTQEIEQNPVLELDLSREEHKETLDDLCVVETDPECSAENSDPSIQELAKKRKNYQESLLTYAISLDEHLLSQARLSFLNTEDFTMAKTLIGHLDRKGFLSQPLSEIFQPEQLPHAEQILSTLQTFDPLGVCAHNLQESLLIQLRHAHKTLSVAFQIIENHFEELLAHKIPAIAKKLHLTPQQIQTAVQADISPLNLHPGYAFEPAYTAPIVPDIHLDYNEERWEIQINHSYFPHFHVNPLYKKSLENPSVGKEEHRYLERHIASGRWLKKIVKRRKDTLLAIAEQLIKKQAPFLQGEQKTLVPMSIQEIAAEMGMHDSTIARAISNKYLSCSQGVFSLRSFFTQGLACPNGQKVSSHTVSRLLVQMISQENKTKPLSDEELVTQFKKIGIPCARRTMTKYRQKLNIAPAAKRRMWD